ncbi:MAG: hypothetical protein F4118_11280 [Acidimicrobiaceae bacterium]|nr:hypothetical protein [Acidimicrobiaceae bacterium]MYI36989.1 hypothetical protein [Acidimicrobiaceae bacterium]
MAIADPDLAMEQLREFLQMLNEDAEALASGEPPMSTGKRILLQPLIEKIAREIDPGRSGTFAETWNKKALKWELTGAIETTIRLLGILKNRDIEDRIFGPIGPTLAASGFHLWVWNAVASLWDDGHYEPAVHQAGLSVQLQTQLKVGRRDLHGKDLYAQAFSVKEPTSKMPRLRFLHIDRNERPDDWTSAHEGAMHLGMGCAQGIRNPQAHPSDDITEQEALEQLAVLSVLARWVDECEVIQAERGESERVAG